MFEVEDAHANITAAIYNQRIRPRGLKMINTPDELVLVPHVEVGTVGDADGVAQTIYQRARLLRPNLSPQLGEEKICPPFSCHIHSKPQYPLHTKRQNFSSNTFPHNGLKVFFDNVY